MVFSTLCQSCDISIDLLLHTDTNIQVAGSNYITLKEVELQQSSPQEKSSVVELNSFKLLFSEKDQIYSLTCVIL